MLEAWAAGLMLVPAVLVAAREVRAGDLVRDAHGGRLVGPAAMRVVLRLPAGQRQVTLAGPAAAALVRRAGLSVTGSAPVTIARRAIAPTKRCWANTRALVAGEAVTMRDVIPIACGGEVAVIGDVAGTPTARVVVPAGTALGRLVPAATARVALGTVLTLRSVAGPVSIEREVTTMQPGRSGRRVFVRDGEGQVFAAPLTLVQDAQ